MMRAIRRRTSRIRQEYKRRRLTHRLTERIIKDQPIHASLARSNIISADRHSVGFAFAVPLDRDEAFGFELFFGC